MSNSDVEDKKNKARANSESSSDDGEGANKTKSKKVKEQNDHSSSSDEGRIVRKGKETPKPKNCSEKTEAKTSKKMGKQPKKKEKNSSDEEEDPKVSLDKKHHKVSQIEGVNKKNINRSKEMTFDQRSLNDDDDNISQSQVLKIEPPFNMTYDRVKISENNLNGNDKDYQAVPRMYVLERLFKAEKALNDEEDIIKAEFSILFFAFLERLFNEGKYFLKDFTKVMMREKPVFLFNDLDVILKNNKLLKGGVKRWWTKLSNKLNNREGDLKRVGMAMVLKEEGVLLKETNKIIWELLTETIKQRRCKDLNKLSIFSKLFLIKINIYQGIETKSYVPDKLTKSDNIPPETIFEYPLALVYKKTIFSLLYTEEDKYLFNVENHQPIEEAKIPKNQHNDSLIDSMAIVESMGEVVDALNLMAEGLYDIAIAGNVSKFELAIKSWNRLLVTIKGLPETTKNSISWKVVNEKVRKLNETLEYCSHVNNELSKLPRLISTSKDKNIACTLCSGNSTNESKISLHYHKTCFEAYFITLSFRLQQSVSTVVYKKEAKKEEEKEAKKEEEKPAKEEKDQEAPSCKCGKYTKSACKKCNIYICAPCMMKYIKY